jgi:hypothetical protein
MFNVTSFCTDVAGIIYTCDWLYSNADGTVGNTITLEAPTGDVIPVEAVTDAVVTSWVVAALPNTAEELDAQIAENKARHEAEETSVVYTVDENGIYSV